MGEEKGMRIFFGCLLMAPLTLAAFAVAVKNYMNDPELSLGMFIFGLFYIGAFMVMYPLFAPKEEKK